MTGHDEARQALAFLRDAASASTSEADALTAASTVEARLTAQEAELGRLREAPIVEVREVGGSLIASSLPAMHNLQVGQRLRLVPVDDAARAATREGE